MKVGLLSLGRSTFDVELANEKHKKIIKLLENYSCEIIGSKELLLDEEKTLIEIKNLKNNVPDYILILQITFTDASVIHDISIEFDLPISIWAIPEPRLGGRLRLNSFCGLNLASHTLGLNNINFNWLYKDLENVTNDDISNLFNRALKKNNSFKELTKITTLDGMEILKKINKFKIAKIGKRPDGFTTCDYNQNDIKKFCKIRVDEIKLEELFKRSEETNSTLIEDKISEISKNISGLKKVDQKQLKKSVALNFGLNKIKDDHFYDAFAIRCWPETFTKYGGAVCASVSLFSENKTPCACEADVYGAITQLILQTVSKSEVFLTDIVDINNSDNTGVLWHCGQAPISMCDPDFIPRATVHTNRKMPLLFEFPLKEGEVTMMRISKGLGKLKMVISSGTILKRDMAFTGTSGVIKFHNSSEIFLNNLIETGLEHHMAITYGNHKNLLVEVASCMNLPAIEI